jgi:hypothetical protein
MEGHLMLMDEKKCCKNDYTTESNVYVQCSPYQMIERSILKFIGKHQKASNT